MDDRLPQLRKGVLELAVLALLDTRPMYGAEIVEMLGAHPGVAAPTGTVYPLLTRLRSARLVDTRWQESPVGPPRRYYELTAAGQRALWEQEGAWRALSAGMDAILKGRRR